MKKFFEFTPVRMSENALLVSRPDIVSLVNAGTIQVVKHYKIMTINTFQILMTLKLLLNSRANLITINELVNLDLSTHALNVKSKKITLGIELLQHLPNATKILLKLPNGKKILQIYRME